MQIFTVLPYYPKENDIILHLVKSFTSLELAQQYSNNLSDVGMIEITENKLDV